jgi:hypothetical protein
MKAEARLHIKAGAESVAASPVHSAFSTDDVRARERFVVTRGEIEIRFRGEPMFLVDLSTRGVMATHAHRLTLGKHGLLTLAGTELATRQPVCARVVWSRFAKRSSAEGPMYVSGLEITDDREAVVPGVIEFLAKIGAISFDDGWHSKKAAAIARRAAATHAKSEAPSTPAIVGGSEGIRLSVQAQRYLSRNPDVRRIWADKARLSLRPGYDNLEDLTVWEFLGRTVQIDMIVLARKLS